MIVVSAFLKSAIHPSRDRELARMVIGNDGQQSLENPRFGTYEATTYRGRDTAALDRGVPSKRAAVANWPREDLHVWNLVSWFLTHMGYTKTGGKTEPAGPAVEALPVLAGYRRPLRLPSSVGDRWTYTDDPARDPHDEWEPVFVFEASEI